jgi:hypothetical protein
MGFFYPKKKKKKKKQKPLWGLKKICVPVTRHSSTPWEIPRKKKRKILIPNEYGGVFEVNSQPGNATYAKNVRRKESRRIRSQSQIKRRVIIT